MPVKTLKAIAEYLNGEYVGDPSLEIHGIAHPLQASSPRDLALILDEKIVPLLTQKSIVTALTPLELAIEAIPNQIRVRRPKVALARLLELFDRPVYVPPGIHPSAVIDPSAHVVEGAFIGPLCSVGPNSRIGKGTRLVAHVSIGAEVIMGEDCLLHAGVRVGDRVRIGNRVILQPNAAIGSDGYSYVTSEIGSVESARSRGKVEAQNNRILRINSIGTVVLEDEVEIGANSCIDRATLGETRIKRGTKLDNLVQIAHNVTIGENCLIVAQTGVAGSCTIGDRSVLGGQVGVKDHTDIGEDCIILSQSGVVGNVPDKSILMGSPAIDRKQFLQKDMQIKRLKGFYAKLEALAQRVEQLECRTSEERAEQPV